MTTTTPETPEPAPWWTDHRNLVIVAQDMVAHGDDTGDLIDLMEKPWKWEDTWIRVNIERDAERAAIADQMALRDLREETARDRLAARRGRET